MPPIPCAHCGFNFMRSNLDPYSPKLCNNCLIKEEKRTQKEEKMETVGIIINCPRDIQIEIEEICINQGIDFTKYFMNLYYDSKESLEHSEEEQNQEEEKEVEDIQEVKPRRGRPRK